MLISDNTLLVLCIALGTTTWYGRGLCVPMNPKAVLAGALTPGTVSQATQVEDKGPDEMRSNLFPFFILLYIFCHFPRLFRSFLSRTLCFPVYPLTCNRLALSDPGYRWAVKQTKLFLFEFNVLLTANRKDSIFPRIVCSNEKKH